ncbi:hypothetical protein HER10_EVM0005520 [Colletotrichum scovillei]|uniref:uncharacterized protein n=1 Tax=Colletotrichum scovillei TaxID=1209932 RepID=UPI0015C36D07|nr:uncharacterized protein HER10_EVM0005520 [Colletotrichum scovillei]KAF4779637.1 hypothetical protein HER10_EVM0005520 [Colletotrichum scovillei]
MGLLLSAALHTRSLARAVDVESCLYVVKGAIDDEDASALLEGDLDVVQGGKVVDRSRLVDVGAIGAAHADQQLVWMVAVGADELSPACVDGRPVREKQDRHRSRGFHYRNDHVPGRLVWD